MAELNGYEGTVDWGTIIDSDVHNVHAWSLDVSADMADTTNLSSTGWRSFKAALKGWTGSIEIYTDGTNAIDASEVGTSATIKLHSSDIYWLEGTAHLSAWHPAVTVDGVQTQTLDFQGDAILTYSDA